MLFKKKKKKKKKKIIVIMMFWLCFGTRILSNLSFMSFLSRHKGLSFTVRSTGLFTTVKILYFVYIVWTGILLEVSGYLILF